MERYFKDPRRARDRYLKRHYGIGIEEYESLLTQQNGKCRTCSGPPNGSGNLHVDHKHVDGYRTLPPSEKRKLIRGLLCYKCNVAVGFIDDKPEVARNIADYLEQS